MFKKMVVCLSIVTMFVFTGTVFSSASNIQSFYNVSKAGKKIVFVGDSTTDGKIASALYDELNKFTLKGKALDGALIIDRGSSGNKLQDFIVNKTFKNDGKGIQRVIDDKADLYVFSYGINDIRNGMVQPDKIKQDMKTAIDELLNKTDGYILLRVPNTFLTTDTFLTIHPEFKDAILPDGNSQQYSTSLRDIYLSFRDYNSRLDVIDIPSLVFGQKAIPSHPLMNDILHPNDEGYRAIVDAIVDRISGKTHDEKVVKNQLNSDQSNILIEMCSSNYFQSGTTTDKEAWHKMADELRKASGKPFLTE